MVTTTTGASISRALSIGVCMTALTGPVLAAYSSAAERNHDSTDFAIAPGYIVIGILLIVMFIPAMREVAAHGPAARHVWLGTVWLLGCLGLAYLLAALAELAAIVAFPLCAVAAAMGAIRINERLKPKRPALPG